MAARSPIGKDPSKSKSRTGCLTCKEKRLKCDETKPACTNCAKRNLDCPGYQQIFKWPSKCQINTKDYSVKSKKRNLNVRQGREQREQPHDTDTTGINYPTQTKPTTCYSGPRSFAYGQETPVFPVIDDGDRDLALDRWDFPDDPGTGVIFERNAFNNATAVEPPTFDLSFMMDMELFSKPLVVRSLAPSTSDRLSPLTLSLHKTTMQGDLEWVQYDNDVRDQTITNRKRGIRRLLKGFYGLNSPPPTSLVHQETRLVEYYFSTISGLYSCFDSHLNPFRSFVGQMWTYSASMYYVIQSMAAAHLANDIPSMRRTGADLHLQASQHLSQELTKYYSQCPGDDQALLVLLLIGLSSSWHRPGDLGLPYLRTARSLMHIHPAFNALDGAETTGPLQSLFEEAMVYWEMMMSFVADDRDVNVMHSSHQVDQEYPHVMEMPHTESVGPLDVSPHPWTGISPQSQMLLAQVGRLVRRVRAQTKAMRETAETQFLPMALNLEESLLAIQPLPTTPSITCGDHLTKDNDFIVLAQATRDCGLLELYRIFPELLKRRLGTTSNDFLDLNDPSFNIDTTTTTTTTFSDSNLHLDPIFPSPSSLSHSSNNQNPNQSWLTSFAVHILLTHLQSIPDTSSVRCHQLLLLLIAAAELRLPRHDPIPIPITTGSDSVRDADSTTTQINYYDFCDADLEIGRARAFARARLGQLAIRLPAQPVKVMLNLLDEVWGRMDRGAGTGRSSRGSRNGTGYRYGNGMGVDGSHGHGNGDSDDDDDDVFWVDIMIEKGWHTVMG